MSKMFLGTGDNIMKSWLIVTITWTILQLSASIVDAIVLDLANPTEAKYSSFLTSIRDDVKDPKLNYGDTGIPVIGAPKTTYLRIDLRVSTGTVSLALKRSDLYLSAILAKNNRYVYRAYYFSDLITPAQLDKIFPEAKTIRNQQKITEYQENYASIEKMARQSRKEVGLGISKLITYLGNVNGNARQFQNEAKFMLVAIQMVCEAACFGYIQQMLLDNFPYGFSPDDDVIIFERNWKRISEAIKGSKKGVFPEPLVLDCLGISTTLVVSNAAELNMELLKYLGNALLEPSFVHKHGIKLMMFVFSVICVTIPYRRYAS